MEGHPFFNLKAKNGNDVFDFRQLQGKVVLVVNVASLCGYSPQYNELQELYEKYQMQGFEIVAFPCNQFAGQEPGDEMSIRQYVKAKFQVSFPVLSKIEVNGSREHPVYGFLKSEQTTPLGFKGIRWNFEKFLIDREGNVLRRFDPGFTPRQIDRYIQELIH